MLLLKGKMRLGLANQHSVSNSDKKWRTECTDILYAVTIQSRTEKIDISMECQVEAYLYFIIITILLYI